MALILEAADSVKPPEPPGRLKLEAGYTEEQFEEGRAKLKGGKR